MAVLVLPAAAAVAEQPCGLCVGDVISKMNQREENRGRTLSTYSAIRHYTLRGEKGRTSEMTVRLSYRSDSGKSFEVLSQNGSDGIFSRVFEKVLQAEAETSRDGDRDKDSISPENYDFRLLGMEDRDGRSCYTVRLLPKRKSKYLIDGSAWIDAEDFALVRLEGRTAGSVSFWIGRPYIVQSYEKVGGYWLASKNDSVANAKFIGRTELTIDSSEYSVPGLDHQQVAQRFGATAN